MANEKIIYLGPEEELLNFALEHPKDLSGILGISSDAIVAALDACRFVDHQYRPGLLSNQLGLDLGYVVSGLVRGWLKDVRRREEAQGLMDKVVPRSA